MSVLKVAVISDSQAYPSLNDWGMGRVKKAFELLATMKPDVLLNAGDLADGTNFETFRFYRKLVDEFFPSEMVHLACAGNHDYWVPVGMERDPELVYRNFCEILRQKNEQVLHEVVAGYSFIIVSEDIKENQFSAEIMQRIESELRKAVVRAPEKPVFVVTHYPPAGTMAGCATKYAQVQLREIFDRYPQVISISGHTHYPLEDERSIWQGDFTAFQTSTLSYGCMDDGFYNACGGCIIPFAREAVQALFMEISDTEVVIRRYNVEEKREIKPLAPWKISLPYDPDKAVYTDQRKLNSPAPRFPEGAMAYFRYDFGYLYLVCDPAEHPDLVHHYRVRVFECGETETLLADKLYVSPFYRLADFARGREVFRLPGEVIKPLSHCRFEIIPVESFGNEGEALVMEADIPWAKSFRSGAPECPQE